jgi:hypothetical protein
MNSTPLANLEQLLKQRLLVIGDHALREKDSVKHLAQLRVVSEALDQCFKDHRNELPARLCHFLSQASYQKALEYIQEKGEMPGA